MALSSQSARRLAKEFKTVTELETSSQGAVRAELVDDSLAHWSVKLSAFDEPLKSDLVRVGAKAVHLDITFDEKYPNGPPFVRVLSPKFKFHTGHVTVGGSICVELLTASGSKDGWKSEVTMDSVILTVRQLLIDGKARVEHSGQYQSESFARETYERVAIQHDWLSPKVSLPLVGASISLPRRRTVARISIATLLSGVLLFSAYFYYEQLLLKLGIS